MPSMRAMIVTETGDPGTLVPAEIAQPAPDVGEVRIRVLAAGINPVDVAARRGGVFSAATPFVPGWDVSGIVDAVGPGVTIHEPGDAVFGLLPFPRRAGAYAEYAVAPARALVGKPASLSHVEAAAMPLSGLTAWQSLVDTAGVGPGSRVLITAAAGGVGHLAVQLAVARGAEVTAVASARHTALLEGLGAVAVVDSRTEDFGAVLRDFDAVLEAVGGDYPLRAVPTLRSGGTLVSLLPTAVAAAVPVARERGVRAVGLLVESDGAGMRELAALVESGAVRPLIAAVHPLAEAAEAQLAPHGPGKVVLTID
jgi:NADPH:quinone reductase-like Zn-dependent oxidoreductase